MKNQFIFRIIVGSLLLVMSGITSLQAQGDTKQLLQDAVNTWDVLSTNIQIHSLKNHSSPDSVKTMSGSATFFSQKVGLEVSFKTGEKKEIRRVMIDFPKGAVLSTEQFRTVFGKSKDELFPEGFGAKIGIKHFEVDVKNKKVINAIIAINFGTWAPDKNNRSLKLSEIEAEFGVLNLNTSQPNLIIGLSSYLFMPKEVANYLGVNIGSTGLLVHGYVNTQTYKITLGFDLSSDEIPLDDAKTIILKGAQAEFYLEQGKPGLAIGGEIEIRPQGNPPVTFKGEISIDIVERKLFAQAYMPPDSVWENPFGLNEKITITRAGIGFGISFSGPIPTPSFAVTGGIRVKDDLNRVRFGGGLTLAIDAGNPTQNMIDAYVGPLHMKDLVDAFHDEGTPKDFEKGLSKLTFDTLHFRLVPPGPGVTVFEVFYEPGFYAEGRFNYDNVFRGALLIDIDDDGVEAFGGISPIEFQGLKFTGATQNTPPHFYLSVKPSEKVFAMAINGKLEVLGSSSLADIYFSDAGFSATMKTTIMGGFTTELDIAGTDLVEGGSIYVKASMNDEDNLVQKITQMASAEIERKAKAKEREYDDLDAQLKQYEPLYKQKEQELERLKNQVRAEYRAKCDALRSDEKEIENKELLIKQKHNTIAQKKSEIASMESDLRSKQYVRANNLNATSCGGNSKRIGDYCYTCPSGYEWNGPIISANSNGCIKKGKLEYAKARYLKNGPCNDDRNESQITNTVVFPPHQECWECPSGYKRTIGVIDVTAWNRCVKEIRDDFKAPIRGDYVGCPGSMNPTSRKRDDSGRCWECPSGYERTAFRVDGNQACTYNNMVERESAITAKKAEVAALEIEVGDIAKAINNLGDAINSINADVCNMVNNTDAVMLDPKIANSQVLKDYNTYRDIVVTARDLLSISKTVSVGAIRAEAWFVQNAGTALSIVDIDYAKFEGCLSAVDGGYVTLQVQGKFADAPINTSFELYLLSPDQAIKAFADALYASNDFSKVTINSTCTRPNVPRPEPEGKIAELLKYVSGDTDTKLAKKVKIVELPAYAATPKFIENRTDPMKFDVKNNNAIRTANSSTTSSTGTSYLDQEIDLSQGTTRGKMNDNVIYRPSDYAKNGINIAPFNEIGVTDIIPFRSGNDYLYFYNRNKQRGNVYQVENGRITNWVYSDPQKTGEFDFLFPIQSFHNVLSGYNKSKGEGIIRKFNTDGTQEKGLSETASWGNKWDFIVSYNIQKQCFVLFHNNQDNESKIVDAYTHGDDLSFRVTPQLGEEVSIRIRRGSSNWTSIVPVSYDGGDHNFMLFYSAESKIIKMYKLNLDGTLGSETYTSYDEKWTNISNFTVGYNSFIVLYDKNSGLIELRKMSKENYGSVDVAVVSEKIEPDLNIVKAIFNVDSETGAIFYFNEKTGLGAIVWVNKEGIPVRNTTFFEGAVQLGYSNLLITPITQEIIDQTGVKVKEGGYIYQVIENTSVAKAGIKVGDVVVKVNNTVVNNTNGGGEELNGKKIGDTIQVTINRNGSLITKTITLE
jgi:PDZ domain-containing protein